VGLLSLVIVENLTGVLKLFKIAFALADSILLLPKESVMVKLRTLKYF
jgi:hypothetical protein